MLKAQYVETARAKGLRESTVVMRHAVPNALHPLVAYQGVVLPYMLTGEIEVAIVFGLPTVGPAIVGSLNVGDVWVTATFMLVLAATLIIGNIISDILLALLDPRIRLGRSRGVSEHRVDSAIPLPPDVGAGPMPTPAEDIVRRRAGGAGPPDRPGRKLLRAGLAPLPALGRRHGRPRSGGHAAGHGGVRRFLRADGSQGTGNLASRRRTR